MSIVSDRLKSRIQATTDYYRVREERVKLERGLKDIQNRLQTAQDSEQTALALVADLIPSHNAKSLKPLLSQVVGLVRGEGVILPVASVTLANKRLTVTFSQPIFRGWRDYMTEFTVDLCSVCWDYEDDRLVVWDSREYGVVLRMSEPVGLVLARVEAKI